MKQGIIGVVILLLTFAACIPKLTPPPGCEDTSPETEAEPTAVVEQEPKENITEKSDVPEKRVKEGELVSFPNLKATDPDGDKLTYTFTPPLDSNGRWQTKQGDAGDYKVTITANDGKNKVSQSVVIIIEAANRPPQLQQINDILVKEEDKITLKPTASDPDGDSVTFKYSEPFDANGTWQTKKGDTGSYRITVSATDGKEEASIKFFVAVESVNLPPKIEIENVLTVKEGEIITLHPTITDTENDALRVTYSGWMKENSYKTDYDDSGVHTVIITATDGKNTVEKTVSINVLDFNRPPVFGANAFE